MLKQTRRNVKSLNLHWQCHGVRANNKTCQHFSNNNIPEKRYIGTNKVKDVWWVFEGSNILDTRFNQDIVTQTVLSLVNLSKFGWLVVTLLRLCVAASICSVLHQQEIHRCNFCVYEQHEHFVLVKGTTTIKVKMMVALFPSAGNKQIQRKPHMQRFHLENNCH